jgi:hypothetical protein
MRDFNHQTEARSSNLDTRYSCPASEGEIPHILSDVKITHSTLTESCGLHKRSGRNIRRHNVKWKNMCPKNLSR